MLCHACMYCRQCRLNRRIFSSQRAAGSATPATYGPGADSERRHMGRGAAIGPAARAHVGVRKRRARWGEPSRRVRPDRTYGVRTHTGRWLAGCRLARPRGVAVAVGSRRGGRFPPSCPLPRPLSPPFPQSKTNPVRLRPVGTWPMNAQWLSSSRNRLALGWVGSFWFGI